MKKKKPTKEEIQIALDASRDCLEAASVVARVIQERFKAYSGRGQWLLIGRTLNLLFSEHYRLAVNVAENELIKHKENLVKNETP